MIRKIIKYDNSCQILNENDEHIIKSLDYQLSFKIQGAEFSKAYKGYINQRGEEVTWDGRHHLLKPNLKFPIGLFDKVVEFYMDRNINFIVEDQRRNVSESTPIDISNKLIELEKDPRPYQIDAVNKAIAVNRGIIRMATGAGKSMVAALIAAKLGKSTIIYVIGKDLLYQFHKFFSEIFEEQIGIIGDG